VFEAYKNAMRVETERRSVALEAEAWNANGEAAIVENRFGTLEVEIADVRVSPSEIRPAGMQGETPIRIEIDVDPRVPVEDPIVGVSLHRVADGARVLNLSTEGDGVRLGTLATPRTIALTVDRLDVEPGSYRFDVGVYERDWSYVYDYHWQAYPLEVRRVGSGFGPPRRWDER
jgi:lipopolysaccharide transport system ATP-binding protein